MSLADKMSDKEFMLSSDLWPIWPVLPLKKRDGSGDSGFLHGGPPATGKVEMRIGNIYGNREDWTVVKYEDLDALLADGWVVD